MSNKYKTSKIFLTLLIFAGAFLFFGILLSGKNIALFNSKGIVAAQENWLMIRMVLIMLIIVVPVFLATIVISLKYRESNNADYKPNNVHSPQFQLFLWSLPAIIVVMLAVVTWNHTHKLDPFKPIASDKKVLTIQVVALEWKWLFIYPEQNLATVNFVQFPKDTPIRFELTSDAPMNSFWIPQLSGQMYAMPGMKTQLNLMANETGEFSGLAAEISGRGFAGMKFIAKATTDEEFNQWIKFVKNFNTSLTKETYEVLAEQTENEPVAYYSVAEENLQDQIIMKYTIPNHPHQMPEMNHMHPITLPHPSTN